MSSTNHSQGRRLRRTWRKKVAPAGATMRARGVDLLDVGAAASDDEPSWYVRVDQTRAGLTEIESDDIAGALAELWRGQGLVELAAIAPDIAKLAAHLVVEDAGSGELSDDVYAMY